MHTAQTKFLAFESRSTTLALQTGLVLAATVVVALSAHVSVPLPFTPVPMTLQTFAVLLVGLTLGPRTGFITLCAYLAEGALGLPVFSPQGLGGIAQLLGPTGGYLLSYPFAALIAGSAAQALRRVMPNFTAAIFACLAASICIFSLGALWLHAFWHVPTTALWTVAAAPFLLGELLKITAAASLFSGWQVWRSR